MNKMSRYEAISIVLQILSLLVAICGTFLSKKYWFLIIVVLIPIIGLVCLWNAYIKQKEYIQFIEYLNNNNYHNFRVLPLLRMYLHQKKLCNSVHIQKAHITYFAEPNLETKDPNGVLLGDCEIHYIFDIENRNLPDTFKFLCANDNSNGEPQIKYRFNSSENYYSESSRSETVHPHWGGKMKEVSISFDDALITNNKIITLEIVVTMKKAFSFAPDDRDTILCLPINYSSRIDQIEFEIDVSKFNERPFYCSAKRVYCKKMKTTTDSINCMPNKDSSRFKTTINPENNIENAYYFRIGLGKEDPDNN